MITNLISFLYNIKVELIRKKGNSYLFSFDSYLYIFSECHLNLDYLSYLDSFIQKNGVLFHTIIRDRNNKLISTYSNTNYILMRINIHQNRLLSIEDILNLSNYCVSHIDKKNFNWIKLWKSKIDQVDYLVNNNNFDVSSLSIINYYLTLSDIAINIFNTKVDVDDITLTLCHNRLDISADLYDYYSVSNLVIDHFTRDLGEYIKNYVYLDKKIDVSQFNRVSLLKSSDKYMLITRILFPSYFFDIFDDFVIKKRDFKDFSKYFINIDIYEENLSKIIYFILK